MALTYLLETTLALDDVRIIASFVLTCGLVENNVYMAYDYSVLNWKLVLISKYITAVRSCRTHCFATMCRN